VTGPCEHANESSGSIKCREFLDQLSDYQLVKKGSASWSYKNLTDCQNVTNKERITNIS